MCLTLDSQAGNGRFFSKVYSGYYLNKMKHKTARNVLKNVFDQIHHSFLKKSWKFAPFFAFFLKYVFYPRFPGRKCPIFFESFFRLFFEQNKIQKCPKCFEKCFWQDTTLILSKKIETLFYTFFWNIGLLAEFSLHFLSFYDRCFKHHKFLNFWYNSINQNLEEKTKLILAYKKFFFHFW